ncbi:MAG: STM4011 family radical SAM protein [Phycisphaerae bacterium]|nr:STM4011 family radical SAM protein [Tepidisphaeraceae bacterium]
MDYSILYRGPLSSCNYGCGYCPFAKRAETHAQLEGDRIALARFGDWVAGNADVGISVLFTPWGEALIRPWYQRAIVDLTRLPHVRKVAIQTNLSGRLDWAAECDRAKLGLWCTYHPGETTRERFLGQCRLLDAMGVRYSVGVVGLKEHFAEIEGLRAELRPDVYVWVNAYKREDDYYAAPDVDLLTRVDPLFPANTVRHPSRGRACDAGDTVFSVDGAGDMRRCHFVKDVIGNVYRDDWRAALRPTPCTNATCGCHIGYVHMPALGLKGVFGSGLLERIPEGWGSRGVALPVLG